MTRIRFDVAFRLLTSKRWNCRNYVRPNGRVSLLCSRGERHYALFADELGTIPASAIDVLMVEPITARQPNPRL